MSPAQQVGRCCKKSSGAALRCWHRLWRMERCCQEVAPLNTGVHIALHTLKQVLTCLHVSVGHVLSTCPCLKFVKCRELTHLKGTLCKDARQPGNRKSADSFICTLDTQICQKICECPFASDLSFLWHCHVDSGFTSEEEKKAELEHNIHLCQAPTL